MGRTKVDSRKPKSFELDIGFDDTFPSRLIEYLCSLPSHGEYDSGSLSSSSDGRPAKRRKANPTDGHAPIHIASSELAISRQCLDGVPASCTVTRHDVGRYLRFSLPQGRLQISSRANPALGTLSASISINPQDLGPNADVIVSAAGLNWKTDLPGALWTITTLTVKRLGRTASISLHLQLYWNETSPLSPLRSNKDRAITRQVIDAIFPVDNDSAHTRREPEVLSPMDFYDAAFVPPKNDMALMLDDIPGLDSTLFPYQRRTLKWLLRREGAQLPGENETVVPLQEAEVDTAIDAFRPVTDMRGSKVYLSDVFHALSRDDDLFQRAQLAVKGGILSEEMGLGKTLEMLGLILLHTRPNNPVMTAEEAEADLIPSGATLIVTPESLRAQWVSEIAQHAPGLSVKFYHGCKKHVANDDDQVVAELAGHDVVITTYSTLSSELHFATTAPERSRRHERVYPRPKSPLTRISWWRVCLDEAQMIENGFSQAAVVARAIPRINAWGITGTPVKDGVKDLFGLLLFLRYEPFCSAPQAWQALIKEHKPLFRQLFNQIALRHTKALVRDEISLPPQKRYVISMPFTAVEEQHYQSLYREMAEACGLTVDGAPLVDDWDLGAHEDDMRVWLNRLRQTALHPEVAAYNRRTLGQSKSRPMRTVDEVLDAMLEQTENAIRVDERALLTNKLAHGQLLENGLRVREALEIWEDVKRETEKLASGARAELRGIMRERKGDGTKYLRDQDLDEPSGSEGDDLDDNSGKGRFIECQRRLRSVLELQHKVVFFCANAWYQIRNNPELTEFESNEFCYLKKLEEDGYEQAKAIRREILRGSRRKAANLMDKIAQRASEQSFADILELEGDDGKGIESSRIVENLGMLYDDLNAQAGVIDEWRENIIQLLLVPLVDEEDDIETTGEELNESAKIQDELMVYVQALRAAIADRRDAITGQKNELVKHETKTSLRIAEAGGGPAPEKLIELMAKRESMVADPVNGSMRGALSDFRSLISRLTRESTGTSRHALESEVASKQLKATQVRLNEQSKACQALESELEFFTTTMNMRMEYYRQLQAVSDSVRPYEGPRTQVAINKLLQTEHDLRHRVSSTESKRRYLLNLKEVGANSNEPRMCVICQTPFQTGVLTVCGHQFCKECMMLWFKAHHNCPVCKRGLKSSNLHDITIKPQQLRVHHESPDGGHEGQGQSAQQYRTCGYKKTMIYSEFNSDKLAQIKDIELDGPSFTTKVDTLVRHLIWLRESDPGAKSIVFSQYKGFLDILKNAFKRFRIGYTSIDERNGITRFKNDAAVECFLLHARAHSSGLNLVNASHVFLCEPLLNTALELQAIARVDRIGQQHETTVWLYLVSGTVEESIYNLSVQRRMEHIGRRTKGKSKESTPELLDVNIEAANTLELESAALSRLMSKDRTAGETVDKDDLWDCLFGDGSTRAGEAERDNRFQEQAVMGYLAAEAAERRMPDAMAE